MTVWFQGRRLGLQETGNRIGGRGIVPAPGRGRTRGSVQLPRHRADGRAAALRRPLAAFQPLRRMQSLQMVA